MIPYFYYPTINLGFIHFGTWGILAALGFGLAIFIAWKHAACRGQDKDIILDIGFWIIIGSIIGARLVHVFFYEWDFYRATPIDILKIWNGGLSSYGGFLGGGLTGLFLLQKRRVHMLAYTDTVLFALPAGLAIGRIGCFLIHDHPGTLTNFILGVQYSDGTRHDLGLYLAIFDILLYGLFYFLEFAPAEFLKRRRTVPGFYSMLFLLVYGVARFFLDFLRAYDLPGSDTRFGGLTPAQYGSMVFFVIGFLLFLRLRKGHSLASGEVGH